MGTLAFVMWLGMINPVGEINIVCTHVGATGEIIDHSCYDWQEDQKPAWKPLVVPAHKNPSTGMVWSCDSNICIDVAGDTSTYDCDFDKTRILEHDQQNPPKYWCRAEMQ